MLIIKNVSLFDGISLLKNKTVLVSNKKIKDIKSSSSHISSPSNKFSIIDGKDNMLIPGFIDLQMNGGGGVLFNQNPSLQGIKKIFQAHLQHGTTNFFPTFISDSYAQTEKAIQAVQDALKNQSTGVLGIHLEGPFLNQSKRGIHPAENLKTQPNQIFKLISSAKIRKKIITIAPELLNKEDINNLNKKSTYLFAGHTNATEKEIKNSFEAGVVGVTHLFNACSQMTARDLGVVGASLLDERIFSTIIADGKHISDDMLSIAFKVKQSKCFGLISDAMPLIGTNKKSFKLFNELISLKNNTLSSSSGTLAGAHLTMLWSLQYLLRKKLVTQIEAICMTSSNQAEFLGLKNLGAILPRYDANMVLLNRNNFKLLKVIFLGRVV